MQVFLAQYLGGATTKKNHIFLLSCGLKMYHRGNRTRNLGYVYAAY